MLASIKTGTAARRAARENDIPNPTSGLAPGYVQANLIILPSQYAQDFRLLCQRNPVPCPLLAESYKPGSYDKLKSRVPWIEDDEIISHQNCDLRHDAPKYLVYQDGQLVKDHVSDIAGEWTEDHVAFLIGCSFSFETALLKAGLPPRHMEKKTNVPMYRTSKPLLPSGIFYDCTYVVSMRPYKASEIGKVRQITAEYALTHGEPIDWGWGAVDRLGIRDVDAPEWGDKPVTSEGEALSSVAWKDGDVPVFWGCGVTTQEAIVRAEIPGTIMAHAPGYMVVLDCQDGDVKRVV